MPFKSEAQRRFMWSQKPAIAREFEEATPKGAKLPNHVKKKKQEKQAESIMSLLGKMAADDKVMPHAKDTPLEKEEPVKDSPKNFSNKPRMEKEDTRSMPYAADTPKPLANVKSQPVLPPAAPISKPELPIDAIKSQGLLTPQAPWNGPGGPGDAAAIGTTAATSGSHMAQQPPPVGQQPWYNNPWALGGIAAGGLGAYGLYNMMSSRKKRRDEEKYASHNKRANDGIGGLGSTKNISNSVPSALTPPPVQKPQAPPAKFTPQAKAGWVPGSPVADLGSPSPLHNQALQTRKMIDAPSKQANDLGISPPMQPRPPVVQPPAGDAIDMGAGAGDLSATAQTPQDPMTDMLGGMGADINSLSSGSAGGLDAIPGGGMNGAGSTPKMAYVLGQKAANWSGTENAATPGSMLKNRTPANIKSSAKHKHEAHMQRFVPLSYGTTGERREFEPEESKKIDKAKSNWLPTILSNYGTPAEDTMSSPAKGGLMGALGGGAAGALAGSAISSGKPVAAGIGGALGALAGGVGMYAGRKVNNANTEELMRRLPPGARLRDIQQDPVYQNDHIMQNSYGGNNTLAAAILASSLRR